MISLFLPARRTDEGSGTPGLGPLADFWYGAIGRPTASKINVTEDTALNYSACWAATRLLAGTAGMLPLNLYRRDGGKSDDLLDDKNFICTDDPRNRLVERRPNEEMGSMMFRSQAVMQQVNSGNCYSEIERYEDGSVAALWPIHHSRVRVVRGKDTNKLWYEVKNNAAKPTYVDPVDMLHVPSMMSRDGISGMGVITSARESIGMGLATERYGASLFGTGGIPRIVVTQKGRISPEGRENFRKEWKEIYGGAEGDKVALLTEGATVTPVVGISNDDAQFLQTRQHNIEEIARWYGVPPHMLQHLLRATFNNIEELGIEFVQYSLLPWLRLWEDELWAKLLTPVEQKTMYFRFDVNELLRGDSKSRAENSAKLVTSGIISPDEGRIAEGKNPLGGPMAKHYLQGAMVSIDKLGRDEPAADDKTDVTPTASDVPTDASTNVQATALNGAQIVALVDIATKLATEQLPPEGSRALIEAAFPAMDRKLIDTMVAELDKFEPKPEEPNPSPFAPAQPADDTTAQDATDKGAEPAAMAMILAKLETLSQPDNRTPALIAAAKVMLVDAAGRIIRREVVAARNAAKNPGAFLAWLDKFYGDEFVKLYAEVTSPSCSALVMLGISADANRFAHVRAAESRDALLAASDGERTEFVSRVEAIVSGWEKTGAQEIADSVIGGQAA